MSETIIVALISLAGVIITAVWTKNSFTQELDKRITVIETKMDAFDKKIESHNHYAQLFQESVPVMQEQIKVINHRLADLEEKLK